MQTGLAWNLLGYSKRSGRMLLSTNTEWVGRLCKKNSGFSVGSTRCKLITGWWTSSQRLILQGDQLDPGSLLGASMTGQQISILGVGSLQTVRSNAVRCSSTVSELALQCAH